MAKKTTAPPPAYFLSLSLENVRSFGEKQTIYFTEGGKEGGKPAQWTVILGDNGVGKTTVLKALAAVTPVAKGKDQYISAFTAGKYNEWLPWKNEKKVAVFKLVTNGNNKLAQVDNTDVITKDGEFFFSVAKYRPTAHLFMSFQGADIKDIPFAPSLVCYGYGAGRTTGNSVIGETLEATDTCASLFDDRADMLDPQEWFLNIDYGSKLAGENAGQLNNARILVEKMLITVLPGVTELRIASSGTPQKPQISLQFLLFDTWVRLRDMSLGYQTLVVWLTDFASKLFIRYPDSPNPLEEPAIVLIDEIDLHLHPEWQRKLIGFLSGIFKNTQFIATAHSPLVVQAAGDVGANVVLLKRKNDQTEVVQNLEDVRGWRYDQILTSELFDLPTARSLDTERKLQERAALLTKDKLSAAEKKKLQQLTAELDAEPLGETPSEREVNAALQELRHRLLKKNPDSQIV